MLNWMLPIRSCAPLLFSRTNLIHHRHIATRRLHNARMLCVCLGVAMRNAQPRMELTKNVLMLIVCVPSSCSWARGVTGCGCAWVYIPLNTQSRTHTECQSDRRLIKVAVEIYNLNTICLTNKIIIHSAETMMYTYKVDFAIEYKT